MARVRGFRRVAAVVLVTSVAGMLAGCGLFSGCGRLAPSPSVASSFKARTTAIASVPGVRKVIPSYFQQRRGACASREYLQTQPWRVSYDVEVAAGFTETQIAAVNDALETSSATVKAAAGNGLAAWWLDVSATPTDPQLPTRNTQAPMSDARRLAVVEEAAALQDVTVAYLSDSSMTVRVRHPVSMTTAARWLRGIPGPGYKSVYVGTAKSFTVGADVTDGGGVSDAMIATAARFAATHPRLAQLNVDSTHVSAILATKAGAKELVAAFANTPADRSGEDVTAWWPDGNGSKTEGKVGSDVAIAP